MSNSPLVKYTKISPNKNVPRNHAIDIITIHCLPISTELLTKSGWVTLNSISLKDEIATVDKANLGIVFAKPKNIVPIHRENTISAKGRGFEATAKHRMLYSRNDILGQWRDCEYQDFIGIKGSRVIPNAGYYSGNGLSLSNDEIRFLVALQADGCITRDDRKRINGKRIHSGEYKLSSVWFRFRKERKFIRIREILDILGWKYEYRATERNNRILYEVKIRSKPIIDFCCKWLNEKQFTFDMLEFSKEQAHIFLEEVTYWDGHRKELKDGTVEKRYVSKVKNNLDIVSAIASLNGVGVSVPTKDCIVFRNRLYRSMGGRTTFQVKESTEVSCVEVDSGYILIRQNGTTSVVGNCVVGQCTAEGLGEEFASSTKKASSNYGVDKDGRVGMYVEEKDCSWCSGGYDGNGNVIRVNGISGNDNDHRAVTIEVASDNFAPYKVTDKALAALIDLCADICKRNGIKKLLWQGNKNLIGQVDKQNMTVHRWFSTKSCPGDYLYNLHGYIADEVNKKIGVTNYKISKTNLDSLVMCGVISSPDYWVNISLQYLDNLCTNIIPILDKRLDNGIKDITTALKVLSDGKVISSPDYWAEAVKSIKFLDQLIINMANKSNVGLVYSKTSIMGNSIATAQQLANYLINKNPDSKSYALNYATLYINEGKAEGVRGDIAFAQSCLETGNWTFGGDVKSNQNNFAGIGATGGVNQGNSFKTPQEGIRAQIQHLKAYASKDTLKQTCVDPRFTYVTRSSAPYVEWLGIQENPDKKGWATGKDYGAKILNILKAIIK